jgi:hypothetical protein
MQPKLDQFKWLGLVHGWTVIAPICHRPTSHLTRIVVGKRSHWSTPAQQYPASLRFVAAV